MCVHRAGAGDGGGIRLRVCFPRACRNGLARTQGGAFPWLSAPRNGLLIGDYVWLGGVIDPGADGTAPSEPQRTDLVASWALTRYDFAHTPPDGFQEDRICRKVTDEMIELVKYAGRG